MEYSSRRILKPEKYKKTSELSELHNCTVHNFVEEQVYLYNVQINTAPVTTFNYQLLKMVRSNCRMTVQIIIKIKVVNGKGQ